MFTVHSPQRTAIWSTLWLPFCFAEWDSFRSPQCRSHFRADGATEHSTVWRTLCLSKCLAQLVSDWLSEWIPEWVPEYVPFRQSVWNSERRSEWRS